MEKKFSLYFSLTRVSQDTEGTGGTQRICESVGKFYLCPRLHMKTKEEKRHKYPEPFMLETEGGTETQRSGQHPNGSGPPKKEGTNGKRRFVFGSLFSFARKNMVLILITNRFCTNEKLRCAPSQHLAGRVLASLFFTKGLDPDCGRPDGPGKGPWTGVTASCLRSPRQLRNARDPRVFFVVRSLCSMGQIRSSQVLGFLLMVLGELVQRGSCKMLLPTYPLLHRPLWKITPSIGSQRWVK